jgi:raffinose/stachyose/melibiose transport system substrate-binding protein
MKRTISKILSLIATSALLLNLTACGGKTSTSSNNSGDKGAVTIQIWSQFTDQKSTDGNSIAFYKALEAAEKEFPDIKLEHSSAANDVYKTKIKTAMAANELPDIFFTWGASFAEPMVKAGLVLPLDDYLNDGTKDKLMPGTVENFTYDGKIYGLPYSVASANLYCNKELFEKNNLKVPETYEDLVAAVKVFNEKGVTPISLGEKDLWPGLMVYGIIGTRAVGAKEMSEVLQKKKSFDTPEMLSGVQKLKELVDLKAFGPNPLGVSEDDAVSAVKQGKAAMMFMGSWVNGDFEGDNSLVKGKVVPIKFPVLPGGKGNIDEFHGGSGETFMVSANTKEKEASVKVAKFICETMSKEQYLAGSGAPAWKGDMGDTSKLNPLSIKVSDLTKSASGYVYWLDVMTNPKSAETINNAIAQLIAGKITPEEFCKELQKINTAE